MATSKQLMLALPTGNLDAYCQAVNSIPLLTQVEEQELARRYREHDDLDAAWQLVMAHLRFVVRVARGYAGYGLAQGDLIQEGNIGLMKAVKRFDPSLGVRLVSFAVHWIRAEMIEFILRNWRIVKVATTKAQRKLFFNLRGAKKRLGWLNPSEVDTVADDLGVSSDSVLEMERRLSAHDPAFDGLAEADDEDNFSSSPAAYLQDMRFDPATRVEAAESARQNGADLQHALENLDERSRAIITERWLADEKATLQDLAARYRVSAERIRQIEKAALLKLRTAIKS